jgi:magnesium chelatase family protein
MLIASMNPCPCGYYNHPEKECVCGPGVVKRYLSKISGPLLDRIDLHVEVTPVSFDELTTTSARLGNQRRHRQRVCAPANPGRTVQGPERHVLQRPDAQPHGARGVRS